MDLDDREKIMSIFNSLLSNGEALEVRMEGEDGLFTSRLIGIKYEGSPSQGGQKPRLLIDRLTPDKGNNLIESAHRIFLGFSVRQNPCSCSVQYVGLSNVYPCLGVILSFPESIEVQERRSEERITYENPELVPAEVRLGKGTEGDKVYTVNIINNSTHGLGLLVTRKDFDLLHFLDRGDTVPDITFFHKSDLHKVSGTVRHKTKIESGHYKGSYIIGIEWRERRIYRLMVEEVV